MCPRYAIKLSGMRRGSYNDASVPYPDSNGEPNNRQFAHAGTRKPGAATARNSAACRSAALHNTSVPSHGRAATQPASTSTVGARFGRVRIATAQAAPAPATNGRGRLTRHQIPVRSAAVSTTSDIGTVTSPGSVLLVAVRKAAVSPTRGDARSRPMA